MPSNLTDHLRGDHHGDTAVDCPVAYLPVFAQEALYHSFTWHVHVRLLVERRLARAAVAVGQWHAIGIDEEGVKASGKAEGMEDLVLECGESAVDVTLLCGN